MIEVFGAPGVGKSTLCNDTWPPSIPWDGRPAPASWGPFLECAARLHGKILPGKRGSHWASMFSKAVNKTATLSRMPGDGVYVGVGLVMRGLDLCWRIPRISDVFEYLQLVPIEAGAVSVFADLATIRARNAERGKARPSRELSHVAASFQGPQRMAVEILRERGVSVLELDTRLPVVDNVDRIRAFAGLPAAVSESVAA